MRSRTLSVVSVMFLAGASGLLADTIPGGNVSGTWHQSHSPYYIAGNITLPTSDTLTIEPGVEVNFLGYYAFGVGGLLQAVGTETDSIRFTASADWFGLVIQNAPDSSRLTYCTMEAVSAFSGLIYCVSSNPVISRCRISDNTSYHDGGGITLVGSNPRISYCTIQGNSGVTGGGIRCSYGSAPRISHCVIDGNRGGYRGGGIAVEGGSSPVIDSCVISRNYATAGGGIAVLDSSSCTIIACTVSTDSTRHSGVQSNGGGIYMDSRRGSLSIVGSTVDSCVSAYRGGGIYVRSADSVSIVRSILDANRCYDVGSAVCSADSGDLYIDHCDMVNNADLMGLAPILLDGATDLTLTDCIFRSHNGYNIYFNNYSSALVSYSDFYDWGSSRGPFGGNPPAGLGTLVQTNANGDSCDLFYNILLDPLFVDFPGRNYHLTAESPCIDAGDPASPPDPDSTCTDMGALFFLQTGLAEDRKPQVLGHRLTATIIRGVLVLGAGDSRQNTADRAALSDRGRCGQLLDAAGRKVMELYAGANDVSRLAPGIYFVRPDAGSFGPSRKLLVVR